MDHIEQRTGDLLTELPDYIWDGRSLPIPVEDIADTHAGLLVRDVEDMSLAPGYPELADGQTISGLLLPSRGEIWVNAEEARQWPARRRFTIAHELGHWYLHQHGQQSLFCRHGSVDEDAKADPPELPEIEAEANWFAASLLMPAGMVRREYERTGGDFGRLCQIFRSSGAAMGRRLHQTV
jgi:hypothetical protein